MKKIAWCTPFSAASSISEFSHSLIESNNSDSILSSKTTIDVIINENGQRYSSSSNCLGIESILNSKDSISLFSKHYDHIFYNLGNNKENHNEIFKLSNLVPGVAILHDYVYQHYLAGRIFADYGAPNVYAYLIGRHYGAAGLKSVYASQIMRTREARIGIWDTDLTSRYPLIEAIVMNPMYKGIVVHSDMAKRAIEKVYQGPILKIRLPGDEKESPSSEAISRWKQETSRKNRVTIGLIGHIQRGKQIHRLIEAILNAPHLVDLIQSVIIAGKPSDKEYVEYLNRLVSGHSNGAIFRIEVNVTHERLQEIKEASDFFVNMRYPNTEGGSGSLIEQMASNKPVIVLDSGIFSEVDSGVIKIADIEDRSALQTAVFDLASRPELRISLGDQARQYAQTYMSKDYIREIIEFSESLKSQPESDTLLGVHDILQYDKDTRGPEPLFTWSEEALLEFANILFQQHFEPGFVTGLVKLSQANPVLAYENYSFARTLLAIFEQSAKGEECKYWVIPAHLNANQAYVFAMLKTKSYSHLASIFAPLKTPHLNRWATTANRFSSKCFLERFALVIAVWNSAYKEVVEDVYNEVFIEANEQISSKFLEVVRLVSTLSTDDFNRLLLSDFRQFFDSNEYISSYSDLENGSKTDHDILIKHYEDHGRQENRLARISSQKLISATKA